MCIMMHCNERVKCAMFIPIWVPTGIAMRDQSLIKNASHPLSLGDGLDMCTFQSYISTSTIYYIIITLIKFATTED